MKGVIEKVECFTITALTISCENNEKIGYLVFSDVGYKEGEVVELELKGNNLCLKR